MTEQPCPAVAAGGGPSDHAVGRVIDAALRSLPHVSVLLVDTDLRFLAVLGEALAVHGYDAATLIGRRVDDVLPAEAAARTVPRWERALRGETVVETAESLDRARVYSTTFGPAVEDGVIIGAVAVVRDVTVESRARAELASTDELHQMLMSNVSDVIVLTSAGDGRATWVSPSAEWMTGWAPAEIVGRAVFDFVHPDDRADVLARRAGLADGSAANATATYRFRRSDGTWIWVESRARTVYDAVGAAKVLVVILRDVTDRLRLQTELTQAQEMFELSFAAAPIGMALVDLDGRFIKVNDALCGLLGRDRPTLVSTTFQMITHPDDLGDDLELQRATLRGARGGYRMEKRYLRPDGTVVWTLLAVSVVRDEHRPRFFIAQIEDITERKDALRQMERLATTDSLTGLPNRLLLMDRLRHALEMARRGGWLVGVLFIDLDRFKQVNDNLGHEAGDELLRQTAIRLAGVARDADTVTRIGGDEFVMVCEQITAAEQVSEIAERMRNELRQPFTVFGHDVRISASVGVTAGNAASGETLLRDADRSMYADKRGSRADVDVYTEALEVLAHEQLTLHAALREGIPRGELRVFYQPIMDLRTGATVAREALVRWAHPRRGLLPPAAFLGGIDRSRLGVLLGETVLTQACRQAATWPADIAVHVNISARHLAEATFPAFVARCLAATGTTVERLVLEITESLVLAASPSTLASANALAELGVGLSLDDFGTGYSSVTALHRLPIDSFKIDRSFVADLPDDPVGAALVEGLISLGSHMDLDVVAEGIETREQAEWLTSRGCPHGQGFHFGRPAELPG